MVEADGVERRSERHGGSEELLVRRTVRRLLSERDVPDPERPPRRTRPSQHERREEILGENGAARGTWAYMLCDLRQRSVRRQLDGGALGDETVEARCALDGIAESRREPHK